MADPADDVRPEDPDFLRWMGEILAKEDEKPPRERSYSGAAYQARLDHIAAYLDKQLTGEN